MKRIKKVLNNNKGMMMIEAIISFSVMLVLSVILMRLRGATSSLLDSTSEKSSYVENDNSSSDEDKILNIEEIIVK